jgi:hypothetical protein
MERDVLNQHLVDSGYGPISTRTYTHYNNLLRTGYTRYISINRFDVARAGEPYENASAQGRYSYRSVDVGVQVTFIKSSRFMEAAGRAVEVGDVGAVLTFTAARVQQGLRLLKPSTGDMVLVRFMEIGRTAYGRIVESDLVSEPTRIEVEYENLTSIADIASGRTLPSSDMQFTLITTARAIETIDVVGRRIYLFFELIEAARAVINAVGARQVTPVYASPPTLRQLIIESPPEILLQIADAMKAVFPYASITGFLLATGKLIDKRLVWYQGTAQKSKNKRDAAKRRRADAEAGKAEEELRIRRAEADVREAEAEVDVALAKLKSDIVKSLRKRFRKGELSDEEIERILDNEMVPVLQKLADSGVSEIQSGQ